MKIGADHRLAEHACLNCGHKLDAAMGVGDDARPVPGDVTLCINCGHLMAFADDLSFRELTEAEIVEVAGDKRVVEASRALAAAWAMEPNPTQPTVRAQRARGGRVPEPRRRHAPGVGAAVNRRSYVRIDEAE